MEQIIFYEHAGQDDGGKITSSSSYPTLIKAISFQMVRNYKRKSDRRSWSEDSMIAAMHACKQDNMSCNGAAERFGVPEATLRRYLKRNVDELPIHGGRHRSTFDAQNSKKLLKFIKEISERSFGLTSIQCRRLAFEYAEANNIDHPFNKERKMAGKDWLSTFIKVNNLALRAPEATSIGRSMGFNRTQVEKFFSVVREIRIDKSYQPHQIYNIDESGLSTVPTRLPKVVSPKGVRRVTKIVSAERGKNVTVVCGMNASGQFIPPFLLYPRKRMRPEFLNGTPPGTEGCCCESGWMTADIFLSYLKHFVKHVRPSATSPVLLFMDNHTSHVTLQCINFCRESHITVIGFPPHTTHRLQPLDVGFFGPLKTFYSQACDNFMVTNPGRAITEADVGQLLNDAYSRAATVGNAVKSFKACGIEPFNPQIFSDEDFAPSKVTERQLNETVLPNQPKPVDDQPGPSSEVQPEMLLNHEQMLSPVKLTEEKGNNKNDVLTLPSTSREVKKRKRPTLPSMILTSSPVKKTLEEKQNEKREKEQKREENQRKKKNGVSKSPRKPTKGESTNGSSSGSQKKTAICPGCEEEYQDPPTEEWIQCKECAEWWHEECSNYEGGNFICDYC